MPRRHFGRYWRSPGPKLIAKLLPNGRDRSFLLDTMNPVLRKREFQLIRSPISPITGKGEQYDLQKKTDINHDGSCTAFESNPYLRMLASSPRTCFYTGKLLPSDLLVRLGVIRVPEHIGGQDRRITRPQLYLLPDGIENRRFRSQRSNRGIYAPCEKKIFETIISSGRYKRFGSAIQAHSLLSEQVSHQIRLRVIQELELLSDRLQHSQDGALEYPVLRRLSMAEWRELESSGALDIKTHAAVMLFPTAGSLKAGNTEGMDGQEPSTTRNVTRQINADGAISRVPSFHCDVLFPGEERTNLEKSLSRVLQIEDRLRKKLSNRLLHKRSTSLEASGCDQSTPNVVEREGWWRSQDLPSEEGHVYVLRCDERAYRRADTAGLVIALWRLGAWEGG